MVSARRGPAAAPRDCRPSRTKDSISRRVTDGDSSESPWAMVRIPARSCSGATSLSRKPLAPAVSASKTYSSRSKVVRISTRGGFGAAMIRRVASRPSMPGIRMSISAMSGRVRNAASTASAPSSASATTRMSGSVSRIILNPARTSAWSSAISTLIVIPAPRSGSGGGLAARILCRARSPCAVCRRRARPGRRSPAGARRSP